MQLNNLCHLHWSQIGCFVNSGFRSMVSMTCTVFCVLYYIFKGLNVVWCSLMLFYLQCLMMIPILLELIMN